MDTNELIMQLSNEAVPTPPMPNPWRLATKWVLGLLVYSGALFVLIEPRADLVAQMQSPVFVLELALLLCMVISSTVSAAMLSFPDMHQKPEIARLPLVFFGLFAALMGFHFFASTTPVSARSMQECMCTLFITLYAFVPAAWLFFMMRNATSTCPRVCGSVVVIAAFSLGAFMLRLSEPNDDMMHFILFHYVPMLAAALVGVALGRKLLRW